MKHSRGIVFTILSLGILAIAGAIIAGAFIAGVNQLRKDFSPLDASLPPDVKEFPGPIVQQGDYKLSGPYTHDNLTVFLVHGPDRIEGKNYLTLQEALEQHAAIVHETGNVNELSVENLSSDVDVYIQSGDIVKGGKQDRVLHYDLVLSPRSGRVPLASFCVESGRWQAREGEGVLCFVSSDSYLPDKDLKLAAKYEQNQQKVWSKVAATRARLKESVGRDIPTASESSLQLTLDSAEVQESVEPYLKKLSAVAEDKDDVIGFAYAINGKINSAEVYSSHALFGKLWPKLLKASAVEALAEQKTDVEVSPVSADAVRAFLADAERGKAFLHTVSERTQQVMQETDKNLLFETRDQQRDGTWMHRSYLTK
ncbi:MAG TPA: DUF6569 family protein [Gemmataceae bacterium]